MSRVAKEEDPLLEKSNNNDSTPVDSVQGDTKLSTPSWVMRAVAISALIFTVTLLISTSTNSSSTKSTTTDASVNSAVTPSSSSSFEIKSLNYGYGELESLKLLPWDALVEPYKEQGLLLNSATLNGVDLDLTGGDYSVEWSIGGKKYTGSEISVTLQKTGVMDCTVTVIEAADSKSKSSSHPQLRSGDSTTFATYRFRLGVKYIRRELRAMTEADSSKYFKAMKTIYSVGGEEGRSKYGSKYKSAEEFLYTHLNGAGTYDCDHWHDGAGILTHHVAVTLEFEQSLQSIDPSISMPYWEYGMDAYLYDDWKESPVFNANWFGEANPSNDDHRINDGGMWTDLKMPDGSPYLEWDSVSTKTLNPFVNAYGTMRSPWNQNDVSYVGRKNLTYGYQQWTMPACYELRSCFQEDSLAGINDCVNGYTHGPVHIMIGGAWDEGPMYDSGKYDYLRAADKLLLFKVLWRQGYTRCPSSCTAGDDCKCAIPDEYFKKFGAKKMLTDSNAIYVYERYLKGASEHDMVSFLRAVEDPGTAGEMFSSAASYDPTFWPLHGAADRLVAYKRALLSTGELDSNKFDSTWAFTTYNKYSGAIYLEGTCDWSGVKSQEDLTLPVCDTDGVCYGHAEDDVLEFTNFVGNDETYTNSEMFEFIHPFSDDLPYTYDTLSYSYCTDQGYDFMDFSSSKKQKSDLVGSPMR